MKISSKGRHAVRIMSEIAKNDNTCVSVSEIAEKQNISIKYTEQIINKLVKNNLLLSFRGVQGGYKLTKKPSEYKISEILSVTGDTPQIAPCLQSDKHCPIIDSCDSIGCWETLNKIIFDYLSHISLQDVLDKNYKNK